MVPHLNFWIQQPALLVGLTLLFGISGWIGGVFWGFYLIWLRKWPTCVLLALSVLYGWGTSPPTHLQKGECTGYFSIHSLQPHHSPFYSGLLYKGVVYLPEGKVPCSVYVQGDKHPPANVDYIVKGKMTPRSREEVGVKVKEWTPVQNTWSLAEFRYQMKERLRSFLSKQLPSPRVAVLLSSLLTGDVEDRSLRYEFGRLGLQHLLAISGFHFGLLVAFCSFFLSLLFPQKLKLIALLFLVTLYFIFVGPSPAVQRSWVAASLYLTGTLLKKRTTGLNLLGVGLCIEVILNPLVPSHIGFQLSFISCGGILLLYPLIEKELRRYLPKRDFFQVQRLVPLSRHAHLISSSLRKAMALGLAVNVSLLPLLLYHFHQFPLLSLLYNLFFPFLISVTLFGLLVALGCHLLWAPLGHWIFGGTDWLTAQLLNLVSYPPLALDYIVATKEVPGWAIPIYLFGLFCLSLYWKERATLLFPN